MINHEINFTNEEIDRLKSYVNMAEVDSVDEKGVKLYETELTRDYLVASDEEIIGSQNKVFNKIADTNIDYGKEDLRLTEALPIIEAFAPYNTLLTGNNPRNKGKVEISTTNYKDILREIATNLIKVETGMQSVNSMAVVNGQVVNLKFNGMDEIQPVEMPEKPGLFKRFLHAVFGAYKQEFEQYENKLTEYNINTKMRDNKKGYEKHIQDCEQIVGEYGTQSIKNKDLSIDEGFMEQTSFADLMADEMSKKAPEMTKKEKQLEKTFRSFEM